MRLIQIGNEILNIEGAATFTRAADGSSVRIVFGDGRVQDVVGPPASELWELLRMETTGLDVETPGRPAAAEPGWRRPGHFPVRIGSTRVLLNVDDIDAANWMDSPHGEAADLRVEWIDGSVELYSGELARAIKDAVWDDAAPGDDDEDEDPADAVVGRYCGRDDEDAVVRALRAFPDGLTRTQLDRKCFAGRRSAEELDRLLARMAEAGRIQTPPRRPDDLSSGRGALWALKAE